MLPSRLDLKLSAGSLRIGLLPAQAHTAHPSYTGHSPDPCHSSIVVGGADNASPRTDVAGRNITPSLAVVARRAIASSHAVVGSRCIVTAPAVVAGSIGVLIDRRRVGIDGRIVGIVVGVVVNGSRRSRVVRVGWGPVAVGSRAIVAVRWRRVAIDWRAIAIAATVTSSCR